MPPLILNLSFPVFSSKKSAEIIYLTLSCLTETIPLQKLTGSRLTNSAMDLLPSFTCPLDPLLASNFSRPQKKTALFPIPAETFSLTSTAFYKDLQSCQQISKAATPDTCPACFSWQQMTTQPQNGHSRRIISKTELIKLYKSKNWTHKLLNKIPAFILLKTCSPFCLPSLIPATNIPLLSL